MPQASHRLLADVPSLLAELEAADRFERSAAAEREALLAEVERLRGEMRSALLCLRNIGGRSGTNLNAWNEAFDVIDAALAAAADAPQPESERLTRDDVDELLCAAYPDQERFSVSDVLDVVMPLLAERVTR